MSTLVLEPEAGVQGAVVDKRWHFDAIVAARRQAAVGVAAGQVSEDSGAGGEAHLANPPTGGIYPRTRRN
jgi:hypothetical protein